MKLSELFLNRFLYRDNNQSSETQGAEFASMDASGDNAESVPAGGAAQDINEGNVMIEPGNLPDTTINVGDWGWTQTCAFTSADTDTVTWGAGVFLDAAGNSYSISAGTTGNMAAKNYIYLDLLTSETTYQISTTPADAVGVGKVIIAVAEPEADGATFNLTEATQIVGDNIVANTIDAGKLNVGTLSAITANLGTITSGSISVVNGANTIGLTPSGTNAIFAGPTGAPTFKVTPAGVLTATGANISGAITISSGSGISNLTDAGGLATLDAVGTGQVDTTIISGGKIVTGLLTASNIQTGTLNASLVTVSNINASNINTGTLNASVVTVSNINANNINTGTLNASVVTVSNINASNISTGTLSADRIGATSITAAKLNVTSLSSITANVGSLLVGGSGNTYGTISVRDSSNNEIALLNNNAVIVRQNKAFAAESSSSGVYTQFYTSGLNGIIEMTNNTSGTFGIKDDDSSEYLFKVSYYDVQSFRTFLPDVTGTRDLGSSSLKWDDVFCNTMKGLYGEIYLDQAGRIQVTNHLDPSGTGSYNLGGATRYWADVSYKTLTDRGCLGWFDDGVELQDGRKVSDIEAIQAIKKHPTKKTVYGAPMLDYATFPKVSYKKAVDHEGKEYPRDYNNEPIEIEEEYTEKDKNGKKIKKTKKSLPADGIEMTSMFSIMIGALKELDNRLKLAEEEIKLLKSKIK